MQSCTKIERMTETYAYASTPHLSALFNKLSAFAQEPPPDDALSTVIAGLRCGWAVRSACDALQHARLAFIETGNLHIGRDLQPGPLLNTLLAQVAQTLREAGLLRGWRNELLDVSADDRNLGVIERTATRSLGLRTRAVHLSAWTPTGELWVARRALNKTTDPGMWDTLVGGLAGSGEALDEALLRESQEEAGLHPDDLTRRSPLRTIFRMRRRLPEGYQVEDLMTSTCVLDAAAQPINQDGEVMEIRTLSVEDVVQGIERQEFTLEAALVILEDILFRRTQAPS